MSNVAIFKTGKSPEYKQSVNTPEYEDADSLINPDLSQVEGVPTKYWKRVGNKVLEMTITEKEAVNAEEKALMQSRVAELSIDSVTLGKALVRAGVITKSKLITAIKEVMNGNN